MDIRTILIAVIVLVLGLFAYSSFSTVDPYERASDSSESMSQQRASGTTSSEEAMDAETAIAEEEESDMRLDRSEMKPCVSTTETANQHENPIACVQTNMGTFEFILYLDKVPTTAQNFIDLAEKDFYDNLIFHRVVAGFVIQGGDPNGNGSGGPGHTIPLEIHPDLRHNTAGAIAMARSQDPNSAGSQWYATLDPQDFLDDNYAVFGKVIEGLDVVLEIGKVPVNAQDKPVDDVIMYEVSIIHPGS